MQLSLTEKDVVRNLCKASFYDFLKEFWETIESERLLDNWHLHFICRELQEIAFRVIYNKPKQHDTIINVPPGSTKSIMCSVMFVPWVWTHMPHARFICGSYTDKLALDLSRKSRDVIQSEKYQEIFGIQLRHDQNTKHQFMNIKGGSRYCVGVGGSVTGMHGHFLLIDDPLNPQEAVSEAELKNANDWMNETLPTRKVSKENTPMVLIMQRLHQNDPTGNLLEKDAEPIKHICIPATSEGNIQPPELSQFYKDGLFDPVRLPRHVLATLEKRMGQFGYAGQFQQSPVPLGGGMFDVECIQFDNPPRNFVRRVRYWDKAGTQDGGAYTAGVDVAEDALGRIWIMDVVRGQWRSDKREAIIKQTAILDGRKTLIGVEQEPGSGGKESAENTVRNLRGFRVKLDRPTGDKVLRADPLSTQVNGRNVFIPTGAPWAKDFIEEMRFFPYSTYKDQVDSAAGGFNMLTRGLVRAGAI